MIDINVRAPYHAAVEAARKMNAGGRIIVIGSVNGDRLLTCLISISEDCPKCDDHGRFYTTTNLRARKSWNLRNRSAGTTPGLSAAC